MKFLIGGVAVDSLEEIGSGFFAKSLKGCQAAVLACLGEGLEGFDF